MDVGLSCVAKQTARKISPALLQLINYLNNITQHYLNICPTSSQITQSLCVYPIFSCSWEKWEKFIFLFFRFMRNLFLTYNTIGLDNISLTSVSKCLLLLVEGHKGNEPHLKNNYNKNLFCLGCLVIQSPWGHTRVSVDTILVSNW